MTVSPGKNRIGSYEVDDSRSTIGRSIVKVSMFPSRVKRITHGSFSGPLNPQENTAEAWAALTKAPARVTDVVSGAAPPPHAATATETVATASRIYGLGIISGCLQ